MTAYLCQLLGRRGAPKLLKYWLIVDLNKINIYVKKKKLKTINLVRQREDIDEPSRDAEAGRRRDLNRGRGEDAPPKTVTIFFDVAL